MTICFTGHRPDKLGGYDWNSSKNQDIMFNIFSEINKIIETNPNEHFHFICGGALGTDQMAFHICNKMKLTYDNITTEIAIPFKQQYIKWFKESVDKWNLQLKQADKVTIVDLLEEYRIKGYEEDVYYPAKMQKRNEYMVDNADVVIAVWDGSSGGTGNCVKYAKIRSKEVAIVNPKNLKNK